MRSFISSIVIILLHLASQLVVASVETYEIEDIISVIDEWSVDLSENTLIRYKVFDTDEHGNKRGSGRAEISHILYEGDVCVQVNYIEESNNPDRFNRWNNDSAIMWLGTYPGTPQTYSVSSYMEPGAFASYGFIFSGFVGLKTDATLSRLAYPQVNNQIISTKHDNGEIYVTYDLSPQSTQIHMVMVFGEDNHRIRLLESWERNGETGEMDKIFVAKFSNWASVNGRFRPQTLTFRDTNNPFGLLFEFVEMIPSRQEDLANIPPSQPGDRVNDHRSGFSGVIGSNRFSLDGFHYTSTVPVSGPPVNLEELMSTIVKSNSDRVVLVNQEDSSGKHWISRLVPLTLLFLVVSIIAWVGFRLRANKSA